MTTQTIATIKMGIICKPHIVDSHGHYILENHIGIMILVITTNILMACVLPIDAAKMKKLGDDQLLQLSDSSRYMVSM